MRKKKKETEMKSSIIVNEIKAHRIVRSLVSSRVVFRTLSSNGSSSENLRNYAAVNEPILDYAKNSKERAQLESKLGEYLENASKIRNDKREALFEVPIIIGDREVGLNCLLEKTFLFNFDDFIRISLSRM